jgi:hypothetical protein
MLAWVRFRVGQVSRPAADLQVRPWPAWRPAAGLEAGCRPGGLPHNSTVTRGIHVSAGNTSSDPSATVHRKCRSAAERRRNSPAAANAATRTIVAFTIIAIINHS